MSTKVCAKLTDLVGEGVQSEPFVRQLVEDSQHPGSSQTCNPADAPKETVRLTDKIRTRSNIAVESVGHDLAGTIHERVI